MTAHPGQVFFAEVGVEGARAVPAADLPSSVAFVREGDVEVPVTRVVAQVIGDERIIKSYGEDGRLLSTLRQRR